MRTDTIAPRETARRTRVAALALATTLGGCVSSVHGTLLLNGAHFAASGCRNGGLLGFTGVELQGTSGARVRLALDPGGTGAVQAVVLAPGAMMPTAVLPACGVMQLRHTGVRVNSVALLRGEASLSCGDGQTTLSGAVSFDYCN